MRVLVANRGDAASYYRMIAPFSILRYRGYDVDIGIPFAEASDAYDVLWLQNHASPMAELTARAFKEAGKAVVYDVDDWLFGLPPSWPAYDHFFERGTGQPTDLLRFHERLLELADVVTTTTDYLAGKLHARHPGKDIRVLPNCVMMADWDVLPETSHNLDGPVLGWFGTGNHWDDWTEIAEAVDIALTAVNGHLVLIGAPEMVSCFPDSLARRTRWAPLVPMDQFHTLRSQIKAVDVGLAWATDRFEASKCRSPLKAYQWAAAGVPMVVSATVYGDALPAGAAFVPTDLDNLHHALYTALSGAKAIRPSVVSLQDYVFAHHTYELLADRWWAVCQAVSS